MSAALAAWLAGLTREGAPDTLVHLGAGPGAQVSAMLETGAARIVLVEPNPRFAEALGKAWGDEPRIEIVPVALSAREGPDSRPFHVFNAAPFSSLRSPTGLTDLMPNLREVAQPLVETRDMAGFLAGLDLAPAGRHALIVDMSGEEAGAVTALEALAEAGDPDAEGATGGGVPLFADLLLCGTAQSLYKGSPPLADLLPRLAALDYADRGRPEAAAQEPDFPVHALARDEAGRRARLAHEAAATLRGELDKARAGLADRDARIGELEHELAQARARITEVEAQLGRSDDQIDELEEQKAGNARRRADLEEKLKAAEEKLATRGAELKEMTEAREKAGYNWGETQKKLQEVQGELKAARARIEEMQGELDRSEADRVDAQADLETERARRKEDQARIAAMDARLIALDKELREIRAAREKAGAKWGETQKKLEAVEARLSDREARIERLEAARDEAREETENARRRAAAEAETLRAEAALAIRMQALHDTDLRDLRTRYRALAEAKSAQDTLLRQLSGRLTEAAGHLAGIDGMAPARLTDGAETAKTAAKPAAAKPAAKSTAKTASKTATKSTARTQAKGTTKSTTKGTTRSKAKSTAKPATSASRGSRAKARTGD